MKKVLLFILFVFCYSCTEKRPNEIKAYYCSFENNINLLESGYKMNEHINFVFLKENMNSNYSYSDYKFLEIIFPCDKKSFSLKDSSTCKFILSESDINNNRTESKLNRGIVNGIAINDDLWQIEIKIDSMHYRGIISKKDTEKFFFKY